MCHSSTCIWDIQSSFSISLSEHCEHSIWCFAKGNFYIYTAACYSGTQKLFLLFLVKYLNYYNNLIKSLHSLQNMNATFLNGCAETSIEELSHKNDILKKQNNELLKKYAAKEEEQSKTAEQLARTLMESYKYKQEIDKLTSTCEQLQKEKVNLEIQVKHYEAQLFQYKQLAFDSKKDAGKIFELKNS
ncbi:hypothetical protein CEXT_140201, partial [Caerostris extrusa]